MPNKTFGAPWHKLKDGEWIQPRPERFYLVCCDCALVHRMHFRIKRLKDGRRRVEFAATRAPRLTKRLRKARGWP